MVRSRLIVQSMLGALVTVLTVGCSNTTIDQIRHGYTGVGNGEGVVVIGRRHKSDTETEVDFISCVGKSLQRNDSKITIVSEQQFADSLYPWFEPRTAPIRIEGLQNMIKQRDIRQRISDLGVRYIVWVDGNTITTRSAGSIACSIGPGGAGCLGFGTWDNESKYEASVWDFDNLTAVGQLSADGKGTSYMPAVVVPIPLLARVKAKACKGLGDQLRSFLVSTEQG